MALNALRFSEMPPIDQASFEAVQPEMTSGESILWAAQPNTSGIFHREDLYLIPFSLLWGGFAIFWEAGVAGYWGSSRTHPAPAFFMLWGIPFVVIGQYMIWGRFIVAAWKKRRTFYALTNRRAIVVQDGWSRKTASAYLDTLPTLIKEGGSNGIGTLRFTPAESMWSGRRNNWGVWDGMSVGDVPVFRDIEDVDSIYRLVSEQRERLRETRQGQQ
jgi:hypothetical protein